MYASIFVLSALVAVSTAQYYGHWMGIGPMGEPLDTPEVANAKLMHYARWNHEAVRNMQGRKRREAPNDTATNPHNPTESMATPEVNRDKRQYAFTAPIYPYGSALYGVSPYAYGGIYSTTFYGRKRRDVSDVSTTEEQTAPQKRQIFYNPYAYSGYAGYSTGYYPVLGRPSVYYG